MRQSHIAVIDAPMDLGAGRRGVDKGPSALRVVGLNQKLAELGYLTEDLGNVVVDQPESLPAGPTHARYLPQIAHTCARLAEMVERSADRGQVPLVLGDDHSAAIGTVAGMSRHLGKNGKTLGLLWIDAHADMNTPDSSPSGNIHGMPLACIIGLSPRPRHPHSRGRYRPGPHPPLARGVQHRMLQPFHPPRWRGEHPVRQPDSCYAAASGSLAGFAAAA